MNSRQRDRWRQSGHHGRGGWSVSSPHSNPEVGLNAMIPPRKIPKTVKLFEHKHSGNTEKFPCSLLRLRRMTRAFHEDDRPQQHTQAYTSCFLGTPAPDSRSPPNQTKGYPAQQRQSFRSSRSRSEHSRVQASGPSNPGECHSLQVLEAQTFDISGLRSE